MILLVLFVLTIGLLLFDCESFTMFGGGATSPGTLLQLVAKGPQDVYLTGFPTGGYGRWDYPHPAYGYPTRYYHGRSSPYLGSPYWGNPYGYGYGYGYPIYRNYMYPF